jgi:hypothetical protein
MFIACWPLENRIPGPDFSFKDLKNKELRIIVGPYLKRKAPAKVSSFVTYLTPTADGSIAQASPVLG